MDLADAHNIRTVPDLMYAIACARSVEDRLRIFNRAHYLGLGHKVPPAWKPDGTLTTQEATRGDEK